MDTDPILTFRAPAREPGRVDAVVSPVLELVYASFLIQKRGPVPPASPTTPAWTRRVATEAPDVLTALHAVWSGTELEGAEVGGAGVEAFLLAARYGYVRDVDPERFLGDAAGLAARSLAEGGDWGDAEANVAERVAARLRTLREAAFAAAWTGAHRGLWRALRPLWEREGRPAAEAAAEAFRREYEATGSVLAALPAHHFVRFEAGATSIERAEREGRVLVVPLGLAASGGFHFDVDGTLYVGFGLQAEQVHERTAEHVARLAQRMKAFADPTRALLLALIGRFAGLHLTVGDLAAQVGVSQPTVSGHLRLLRDAGLVRLEKRGNKAFHTLDEDAIRAVLHEYEHTILEGEGARGARGT
jgi:DNA-binding transcriptional ArsR family regulator